MTFLIWFVEYGAPLALLITAFCWYARTSEKWDREREEENHRLHMRELDQYFEMLSRDKEEWK